MHYSPSNLTYADIMSYTDSDSSVRPVLEYSSTAWSTTANTNQQSLDKIQKQALRIITGAMKSTPITFMEQTIAIQPLQQRRQAKVFFKQRNTSTSQIIP